ncbi:MAG: hypothetical protein IPM82_12545 [Saprospiraceae bacterium]|nr:hypothetical protein [Saprospiraceae bacterium]
MNKFNTLFLMLVCVTSLQAQTQTVLDSLSVPYTQAQVWNSFHLDGQVINLYEHYIERIDFTSGKIKRDSIPHGFLMETAPGSGKMAGLSSMLCNDLNLNYSEGDLFVNFYHYLINENKYSRNTIMMKDNKATTSSLKTRYAGTSAPYTWKDYWVYFDLGVNNHLLMVNSKTGSAVYQTPSTKYITSSATNGQFTVKGNEAAYVVKDAGAGEAVFCLLDLERKEAKAKK